MPDSWTDKEFVHLQILSAAEMTELVVNDGIIRDVIKGDNGESSDWEGHAHEEGSSWDDTATDIGDEIAEASESLRAGLAKKEISQTISGSGGTYQFSWPSVDSSGDDSFQPIAHYRKDEASYYLKSDWLIGHTTSGGYHWKLDRDGSNYWRTTIQNDSTAASQAIAGQAFTPKTP